MACAVATLEPSEDFPTWLEAQGVNAEMAQAMDSELGIRDYGVLRACIGDGFVRTELLATARDRLPFGFYAVLRQVVKALQGAEPHDGGMTSHWDDAASAPGNMTLGGLVDVLLALFSGLSRELLMSVQRLDDMDNHKYAVASASSTDSVNCDEMGEEMHPWEENAGNNSTATHNSKPNLTGNHIKNEPLEDTTADVSSCVRPPQELEQSSVENTSRANFARPADNEAHFLPPEWLQETKQEDSAANNSVSKNTSRQSMHRQKMSVKTNRKQPSPAIEIETHKYEVDEVDFVESPQLETCGVKLQWCDVCKSSFSSPYELEAHMCMCTGKKVHHCEVCGRVFLQATGLTIHLRTHTGKAPYTCGVCGDGFWQSSDLKIHLCKHTGEKPYQCEVCGRGFYRVFERKVHMRTHTGEKPHICQVCGRSFLRSSELKIHMRIHTGEKPYVCKVCGHAFKISNDLKKHLRTHTGEKPYSCSVCGQRFAQSSHVRSHERSKHGLGISQ